MAYLSRERADVTYWAWFKRAANRPRPIAWALQKTKEQIGGALNPGYLPPHWRNSGPSAPENKDYDQRPGQKSHPNSNISETISEAKRRYMIDQGRKRIMSGILAGRDITSWSQAFQVDMLKVLSRPHRDLISLKLAVDGAISRHYSSLKFGRHSASVHHPSNRMTSQEWLEGLNFMCKSTTFGAVAYGAHIHRGLSHKEALNRAKLVEGSVQLVRPQPGLTPSLSPLTH